MKTYTEQWVPRLKRRELTPEERAEHLLEGHLSDLQRGEWHLKRMFQVTTQAGNTYRIGLGSPRCVETPLPSQLVRAKRFLRAKRVLTLTSQAKVGAHYCIHSKQAVPRADECLAFKLLLETDEGLFLKIANRF